MDKAQPSELVERLERVSAKARLLARTMLKEYGLGTCDDDIVALNGISRELDEITVLLAAIERLTPTPEPCRVREALVACRTKFAEYVEMHRAKLEYTISREGDQMVQEKIDRNQDMVDLCDSALSTSPAEPEEATEAMRDAVIAAYKQGAMDVHEAWAENEKSWGFSEPDFTEAAHDYADAAMRSAAPIEKREG